MCGNMAALSLWPPPENSSDEVSCRQCLPGYKNIIVIEPGEGLIALVKDKDYILHVLVQKIQP